jgi:hypothetical protein
MSEASFRKNETVYVFYRQTRHCQSWGRKYVAALDHHQGAYRPRTGMSDGWVPAVVVEDHLPSSEYVNCEITWPYFFSMFGHSAQGYGQEPWVEDFKLHDVRRSIDICAMPADERLKICPAGSTPELAVITFRWGGSNEIIAPQQWGTTGSSVSDIFIDSFLDRAVVPQLGRDFEVWTVYITDSSDVRKLADTAQLIFGSNHPARRAKRVCAMYFLYPTSFEEHCIPNKETGEDNGAAMVDQTALFRLMKAVERAGIPTRFPHPSGFYEVLTSKRWTATMSLTPQLHVPPTVSLPRMLIENNRAEAAALGLSALADVKRQQALLRNESTQGDFQITKGVAKLGFSWEALDVKFWSGKAGLEQALLQLTEAIEISEEFTGQPHDMEAIMLQEYCAHDLELRLYVVDGKIESAIYTKFCKIKPNNEFGDFHESFDLADAAEQWMGNDVAALEDGHRQCREITNHWLAWVRTQLCELPPAIRFDYFVGRTAGTPGSATVWTLEICELGFSMLGDEELPNKVFNAVFRSCMGTEATNRQPNIVVDQPAAAACQDATVRQKAAKGGYAHEGKAQKASAAKGPCGGDDTVVKPEPVMARNDAADCPWGTLYLKVPKGDGTTDQQLCTGRYDVIPEKANGLPIWMHTRGDRWLYNSCEDNYWYVGDEEERDEGFKTNQGYIRHRGKNGVMPQDLDGNWERGPKFKVDKTILAQSTAPEGENGSEGKSKSEGKNGKRR